MPKAEVGSTKWVGNKMKAKGLQRLRWYCQICEKQCRDDNGFKQHTMSEGHVRAMLLVGEDPKKFISEYSRQFQHDFLQLLKVAHGEKKVHMNNFYQQYISDKEHIHMNATKWPSLTEFAKHLGREGLCRVEEAERGLEIAYIDNSAAAVRRKEEIKKQMQGVDGDVEAQLLQQQIQRAQAAEKASAVKVPVLPPPTDTPADAAPAADSSAPAPFKMSFGLKAKASAATVEQPKPEAADNGVAITSFSTNDESAPAASNEDGASKPAALPKMSFSLASKKDKSAGNPLASKTSKNPFKQKAPTPAEGPKRPMSNAERIMKEEMERSRLAEERGGKRRRID